MTRSPSRRPPHMVPPAHLSPSPPVPVPDDVPPVAEPEDRLNPVRYGDWERNGIAVDF